MRCYQCGEAQGGTYRYCAYCPLPYTSQRLFSEIVEGIGRFRELWQNYKRSGLGWARDLSSKIGRIGDFLLARERSLRVMLSLMMGDEESSEEEALTLVRVGWEMRRLRDNPLTPEFEKELDKLGDEVYRESLVLVERFKPRLEVH